MVAGAQEGQEVLAPPWVSAVDASEEDPHAVPYLWAVAGEKLEEATRLGDSIRLKELSASVQGKQVEQDEVQRGLLLDTCTELRTCLRDLSSGIQSTKFEELCSSMGLCPRLHPRIALGHLYPQMM